MKIAQITFPEFKGIRCLMMPYIQGRPESVPEEYRSGYEYILNDIYIREGDIGFLTIDESSVNAGMPHRGDRAKYGRALHTEAGRRPGEIYAWGGGGWGNSHKVTLDRNVSILLANNIDASCAVWECEHENTSVDGDIGNFADAYPYDKAYMLKAGEVCKIGILTPHESLPVKHNLNRQFLRILSSGVRGRESYFTENPIINFTN